MKTSIRTKFNIGLLFFLVIILLLSVFSVHYLYVLSDKTSAILKENHYSVIFARDMSENLTNINQEITNCLLTNKIPDKTYFNKELKLFDRSLRLEKNNITEVGEDKLATDIEKDFIEYKDSVLNLINTAMPKVKVINLQKKFHSLYQELILLSQMNEKAVEVKTNEAKLTARNASLQMTIVGSICFLIAFIFTFSFASYFNERFFQLYNGIKEIASNNYGQRLYFKGKDEFYEISLLFNEMAEKLNENSQNNDSSIQEGLQKEKNISNIQELKSILFRIKNIEEQAEKVILKFENKIK